MGEYNRSSGVRQGESVGWLSILFVLGFAAIIWAGSAYAQDKAVQLPSRADFDAWLQRNLNAQPSFKAGDVLTIKDLDRIRPFVPPGYITQLNFRELRIEVMDYEDHNPRRDYIDCSEKYQSQVRLNAQGVLENYVCGQPFANASLSVSDPLSGFKAAWNYNWRWQKFGLASYTLPWMWVRFGGTHAPIDIELPPLFWDTGTNFKGHIPDRREIEESFQGGGTFQRTLQSTYQRVYYSHLAPMSASGGALPVPNAKQFEFKEFTGFFDPFDIRGTAFIIYRYANPRRADDSWAYLPSLRRVRRISVEVKSDSLLGTDHTLEDFYGFSGRVLEWRWRFLGFKEVLAVMSSKYDYAHYFGPNGIVPHDRWGVRRLAVIERVPINPRAPYSSAINFWDPEGWDTAFLIPFDRNQKLWKVFQFTKLWSEDAHDPDMRRLNAGVRATNFQTVAVMDLQNRRATLNPLYGTGFPNVTASHAEKLYDINSLEQVHR